MKIDKPPTSGLRIVKALKADASVVASILTDAVGRKQKYDDHAWGSGVYSEEEVLSLMNQSPAYIAYVDGEPVGTVALQWDDESVWGVQPPNAGYIHRLAVREGIKTKGVGSQIIDWASDQVAKRHRQFLRLDCNIQNTKLCAYYDKQGFTRADIRRRSEDGYVTALYERQVAAGKLA